MARKRKKEALKYDEDKMRLRTMTP